MRFIHIRRWAVLVYDERIGLYVRRSLHWTEAAAERACARLDAGPSFPPTLTERTR